MHSVLMFRLHVFRALARSSTCFSAYVFDVGTAIPRQRDKAICLCPPLRSMESREFWTAGTLRGQPGRCPCCCFFFNTWILSSYVLLATWILVLLFMMLYEALDKNCHDFGRSTVPALILPSEDAPTMLSLSTRAWWGQWFQRISQMTILLCTYILTLWFS